jgi:cellulose synthase/poly-beta-1,6-N-acetylglucosamine synthase-like glycosyltransferase
MSVAKTLFWGSAAALAWTHVGYPLAAGALARVRERQVAKDPSAERSVSVVVAAYNEEAVIERRLENLLALDYPAERLEIVVASDASSDGTDDLVEAVATREPRVRLLPARREGRSAGPRCAREHRGRRRVLRRQRDVGARRAPPARRGSR